ncbi:DNA-directed RNA polymerase subunit N [Candidatus Micrarchaeota archaeon]|nr:DNA-directed RNA polymerase subunit N [Candidatus Micrarchaeota archaeon]
MEFPVRCFTCGAVIGDKYEEYLKRVAETNDPEKVLDEMGIKRMCCRRMFISHVDMSILRKYKRL